MIRSTTPNKTNKADVTIPTPSPDRNIEGKAKTLRSPRERDQGHVGKNTKAQAKASDWTKPATAEQVEAMRKEYEAQRKEHPKPEPKPKPLPDVLLPRGENSLVTFSIQCGQAIGPAHTHFMWQGKVCEVIDEPWLDRLDKRKLAIGGLQVRPLTASRMKSQLEHFIRPLAWTKPKGKGKDKPKLVFRNPITTEMIDLLESPDYQKTLPELVRISPVPIPLMHHNMPLMLQDGYNPEFGIYCPIQWKRPYNTMGLAAATKSINDALQGFTFKTNQDRAHAIAALITPFLRGVIGFDEPIPCWFFKSNRPRVGKDYLAGVRQIIYEGAAFEDAAIGRDPEETRKRITAGLRAGRRFFHFANCEGHLHDRYLIQAVTNTVWCDRNMGSNDASSDLQLPNESDYSFSGTHDMHYSEHFEPRLREIELCYYEENPNARTFENPQLHKWVKENRHPLLSAIYSLFLHWQKKHCPDGGTFTSFEAWARVVGGVMKACELGDPTQPRPEPSIGGNQKDIAMKAVFEIGNRYAGIASCPKSEIYDHIAKAQAEGDERLDFFGDLNSCRARDGQLDKDARNARTKLGMALTSCERRIFSGIELIIDKSDSNTSRWTLTFRKL